MDNSDSRSIDKNKTIKIIGGILAFNVVAFIIAKILEESNLASSTIPTFPQTILVNVVFFIAAFSKRFYFLDKITIMAMTVIVAITSFSMYGADYNSLRGLSAFVDGIIGTIATVISYITIRCLFKNEYLKKGYVDYAIPPKVFPICWVIGTLAWMISCENAFANLGLVGAIIGYAVSVAIIVGLFIYAIIFRKKFEAQRKGN